MSRRNKIILIAVIVILIAAIALFPVIRRSLSGEGQQASGPAPTARTALNVNAIVMEYQTLEEMYIGVGVLIPDEEVDLAFESSGKITEILFREGANVRKGELLARINDKPLKAELQKLEAQLPLAQARVYRQQQLLDKEAVSQESFESVNTDLEKLRADIELAKARLAQTELRAPFDGVIGLRHVSEGAYASPSVIVARLTRLSPLKLEFSVNEKQISDFAPGTTVYFSLDNDPVVHTATVYAIEPKLDRTTFTRKARAHYSNPGGRLAPGSFASVSLRLLDMDNALMVPSISLTADLGRDKAFVYRSGVARQIEVSKGMRTESSVQVTDGLIPGDTLITSGVMQLRDGMPVTVEIIGGRRE